LVEHLFVERLGAIGAWLLVTRSTASVSLGEIDKLGALVDDAVCEP